MMTNQDFSHTLSALRKERGISQRTAAEELGISQALLSHYENGIREPGLAFVIRACDYYRVSADYLLGRTTEREGAAVHPAAVPGVRSGRQRQRREATEAARPVINAVSLLFDLLARLENAAVLSAAARYLSTAVYLLLRQLYQWDPAASLGQFSADDDAISSGLGDAELQLSRGRYLLSLRDCAREGANLSLPNRETLRREFPAAYPYVSAIVRDTEDRISARLEE
ncbi:MAG: helix-turn-helix domain-containing protein [Clostridiales bacterium]|nr:helix-turn-helix domain-containing protein [Clostridiales bacterium]